MSVSGSVVSCGKAHVSSRVDVVTSPIGSKLEGQTSSPLLTFFLINNFTANGVLRNSFPVERPWVRISAMIRNALLGIGSVYELLLKTVVYTLLEQTISKINYVDLCFLFIICTEDLIHK